MTVLLIENKRILQRIVDEFDRVCKKNVESTSRQARVRFERARGQNIDFAKLYRVRTDRKPV